MIEAYLDRCAAEPGEIDGLLSESSDSRRSSSEESDESYDQEDGDAYGEEDNRASQQLVQPSSGGGSSIHQ